MRAEDVQRAALEYLCDYYAGDDAFNPWVGCSATDGCDPASYALAKLVQNGYNMLRDYHDVDDGLADTPLIALSPKNTLQKTGETFVTKQILADDLARLKKSGITALGRLGQYPIARVRKWLNNGDLAIGFK